MAGELGSDYEEAGELIVSDREDDEATMSERSMRGVTRLGLGMIQFWRDKHTDSQSTLVPYIHDTLTPPRLEYTQTTTHIF